MTKQRALISMVWDKHLSALAEYLPGSGIDIVIARAVQATPPLQEIVAAAGCSLVVLDGCGRPGLEERAAAVTSKLSDYAQSAHWMPSLDQDARDGSRPILRDRLASDIAPAVHLLDCLRTVHIGFDIPLLITSEDLTEPSKVVTAWAKSRGIPSLHLAHSIALAEPYTVHADVLADVLAVYGRRGAEGYLDLGIDPDRIVITGNPAWDAYALLAGKKTAVRHELTARHALNPALPIVAFGTTWGARLSAFEAKDSHERTLTTFLEACEALFNAGLSFNAVVKDRPSNADAGEKIFADLVAAHTQTPARYVYATDEPSLWAVGADILVAVESNFLVEATLGGTAAINLVQHTLPRPPVFDADSGIVDAEPDELAQAIRTLLDGDRRAHQVAQARSRMDDYQANAAAGEAAKAVAELMRRMAAPAPATTSAVCVEQRPINPAGARPGWLRRLGSATRRAR